MVTKDELEERRRYERRQDKRTWVASKEESRRRIQLLCDEVSQERPVERAALQYPSGGEIVQVWSKKVLEWAEKEYDPR